MKKIISAIVLLAFFLSWGCNSSKKSLQRGNYYSAVMQAVAKLRRSPNNKKSREALKNAYPLALDRYLIEINRMKSGQDQFKNGKIVDTYTRINQMHDEIRRSPAALEVIPNPEDYYSQLKYHQEQAASERYEAGQAALDMNSRSYAIEAYNHFVLADSYVSGYRDVLRKIETSRELATIKVLVEQVPVPSMQAGLSAQFFQDQLEQFLFNYSENPFVRFYSNRDQTLDEPDQILVFQFDDFVVGQINKRERIIEATKDSVVLATIPKSSVEGPSEQKVTICKTDPRNPRSKQTLQVTVSELQNYIDDGAKIGPCVGDRDPANTSSGGSATENVDVYGTVKATFHEHTQEVVSRGLMSMRIIDAQTNTVVLHEKFPGEFVWINQWGNFNGDERALTSEQLRIANQQQVQPPPPQNLFIEFCKPIYGQATSRVESYYHNL
jgi:hypothetical protein